MIILIKKEYYLSILYNKLVFYVTFRDVNIDCLYMFIRILSVRFQYFSFIILNY